jgi:uncharacterized membrane protein (UPF0127 family)
MVLKEVTFTTINGDKKTIKVRVCTTVLSKFTGLMFKKNSVPLLFIFPKEKTLSIHSFFCRPFRAIWLDKNMKATKVIDAKPGKLNYSGKGKYLLEIPSND